MRRRGFLGTVAAFVIGSSLGSRPVGAAVGAVTARGEEGDQAVVLAERLLRAYPMRRSLAVIGDAYWRDAAADGCRRDACLAHAMEDFLRRLDLPGPELRRMPSADLRACIEKENTRDFSKGRIVRVGGWLLGETEARLCAIAALRTA